MQFRVTSNLPSSGRDSFGKSLACFAASRRRDRAWPASSARWPSVARRRMRAREHRCAASMTISSSFSTPVEMKAKSGTVCWPSSMPIRSQRRPTRACSGRSPRPSTRNLCTSGGPSFRWYSPSAKGFAAEAQVVRQTGRCHGPQEARSEVAGHGLGFSRPVSGRVPLMFPAANVRAAAASRPPRLSCTTCGLSRDWEPGSPGVLFSRPASTWPEGQYALGDAADPYFHLPLWLQIPCAKNVLWAFNAHHLVFIQRLRVSDRPQDGPYQRERPEEHSPHQPSSTVDEDRQASPGRVTRDCQAGEKGG